MGLSAGGWTVLEGLGLTSIGKAAYSITSPGEPVTEASLQGMAHRPRSWSHIGGPVMRQALGVRSANLGCGGFERPSYWFPKLYS